MCSSVFSAFSTIFFTTSAVAEDSAALVSLRCCERLPSDDASTRLVNSILDVRYNSVLAFFQRRSSAQVFTIHTFKHLCRASLYPLPKLLFREVSFNLFTPRISRLEVEISTRLICRSLFGKVSFSGSSALFSCFFDQYLAS